MLTALNSLLPLVTVETPEALIRYTMDQWKKDPKVESTSALPNEC